MKDLTFDELPLLKFIKLNRFKIIISIKLEYALLCKNYIPIILKYLTDIILPTNNQTEIEKCYKQ